MDNSVWIIVICVLIVLVILSFRPWRRKEQLPTVRGAALPGNQNAEVRLNEIASLLRAGKKIEAIKMYRADTGVGLAEAKSVVERLEVAASLGGTLTVSPEVVPLTSTVADGDAESVLLAEIGQLVSQGKKIQAIKLYRERTGVGLAAAKDAVERVEQMQRAPGF